MAALLILDAGFAILDPVGAPRPELRGIYVAKQEHGCEGSPKKEKKMNKCRFRVKNTLWLGWLAVAAFPLTSPAAEHVVLGEEFSAIW